MDSLQKHQQKHQLNINLTPRELHVLHLIGKGFTNPQISKALSASITTIGYHCTNIFRKLGVVNRVQAISKSLVLGILTSDDLNDS